MATEVSILKSLTDKKNLIEQTKLNVARLQGNIEAAEKELVAIGTTAETAKQKLEALDNEMKEISDELLLVMEELEAKCNV